ncbi:MAG TPA: hypothetical protein VK658_28135 [Chryseolinea sp.]|nr:hypothetical protein [Chryseolinea sp.]
MASKQDYELDVNDPNKTRISHFLSSTGERLTKVPWDQRNIKEADNVVAAYKFESDDQSLSITVISATSYHDANRIAAVNGFNELSHGKWGSNGSILYLVQSSDKARVSATVSIFAGEE